MRILQLIARVFNPPPLAPATPAPTAESFKSYGKPLPTPEPGSELKVGSFVKRAFDELETDLAAHTKRADEHEDMLKEVWESLWTFDDVEEVCLSIEQRNALGRYLFEKEIITEFEPLTEPQDDAA